MTDIPPNQLRGAVDLSSLVQPAPPASGTAQGGAAASVTVESFVVVGNDANFGQLLELSNTVPVLVELYAGEPSSVLERVVLGYSGKLILAHVDARANPQLTQAFQATAAPTVAAVIGGKPIALYEGELAEAETKSVLDQVLALAAKSGVTGVASSLKSPTDAETAEPREEPLPPHHQEAFDAIDRGDFAAAMTEYRAAIAKDPRDQLAVAGLAQVALLDRLSGASADELRSAAASQPENVDAQLAVADIDLAGGHLDDAFGRLLDLFPTLDQAGKDAVRERLLSYFEIAGAEDPRVLVARRKLTSLLF